MTKIDPITAEVIRCGLETIADEMGLTMTRTATNPNFSEGHDFSTAIFDYQGRMVALAQAIAIHMGAMKFSVQAAIDQFGLDGLYHGDIILVNDPYYGGSHIPDWTMFTPIFYQGEPILFPATRCHMVDTGGAVPGGYHPAATDIWQEGLRLPPIKIYDRGKPREDIIKMLQVNNRCPTFMGDLQAMIGSNKVGERRIKELLDKYGREVVKNCLDYILDYAEKRFRSEIHNWPEGEYEGESYLEHDGLGTKDIRVHARVIIKGDNLTLDFSGSDTQTPGFVNSAAPNTYSYIFLTLGCMIDDSIPKNDGLFRPVTVILPEGSVVNPKEPAPCNADTLQLGGTISEALAMAFAKAIPERAYAQNIKLGLPIVVIGDWPPAGGYFIDHGMDSIFGGWVNATYGVDGWGALPPMAGGVSMPTIELDEMLYPYRVLSREATIDSAGAGKWRGAAGILFMKSALAPFVVNAFAVGNKYPLRGCNGGKDGIINTIIFRYGSNHQMKVKEVAMLVPHEVGDIVYAKFGGGGGWGDPYERDPEKVREDVLDEYVSLEAAKKKYGVVLDPNTLEIDWQKTKSLRGRKTKARATRRQKG